METDQLTASELHSKQTYYDLLHHHMRIQSYSTHEKLSSTDSELLKQSQAVVANPTLGYRSVDLSNQAYLDELDSFKMKANVKSLLTTILQALRAGQCYISGETVFSLVFKTEQELVAICRELNVNYGPLL
ncbi:hypothetical protein L1D14_07325 [Vibrio tubiashii]|uniref:hypothetical protein n=1 Tax=Vibrio tubiashii TaxID=29498 RepID=UPI001EFC704F|nr:hypothetical protein [Vibrio tubiashii]MCG9576048.1 hypothetical protein [Vibrio tubiashii]